jgi:hypothetical protein
MLSSVADPEYLSWVLDPDFSLSQISDPGSQIPDPEILPYISCSHKQYFTRLKIILTFFKQVPKKI